MRDFPQGLVQELLLRGGLVRAGRAMRHPQQPPRGGVRHRQPSQLRERRRVIPGANRPVHGPVRRSIRYPDQRPVDRPGLQRPVPADDDRPPVPVLMLLPRGPQHDGLQFLQRLRAERVPPSPSARSDAGAHGRAHGTSARSPASAITASRTPAPGTSVISTMTRIMNALASSRSRSPFTYSSRSTARPAIPSITPGPAFSSSHSSKGPRASRDALGCPSPGPARPAAPAPARPPRSCRAPAARPAGSAAYPMTSANRQSPPGSLPFPNGVTRSANPRRHHHLPALRDAAGGIRRNRVDIHERLLRRRVT